MERRLHTSLRLKLAVFVAVVVALTCGALSVVSYVFARKTLRTEIHARLSTVISDRRKMLLDYVRDQRERVTSVASRTRLRQLLDDRAAGRIADEPFREESGRILSDAQRGSEGAFAIWIADPSGRAITATDEKLIGRDFSAAPEFSEGKRDVQVGEFRSNGSRYEAQLAAPAKRSDGTLLGVVMIRADATPIVQALLDRTGLGETGEVILGVPMGHQVRYLLQPDHGQGVHEAPLGDSPAMAAAVAGQKGFMQTHDRHGVQVLTTFAPVGYHDWVMVAKIDEAEAYAPIAELRRLFILVEVGSFLVGLVASYFVAWRFTQPILRLANMAETIAAGKLNTRVVVETQDEIGVLGRAFNHMTEELAHSYAILEERVRERTLELARANEAIGRTNDLLSSVVENIPDMIFMKDARDLRFVRFNKAGEKLIGRTREEMVGKNDYDFFPKEEADFFTAKDREVLASGHPLDISEEPIQTKQQGLRILHTKKVPILDKDGKPVYLLGISEDITELKRAEVELQHYFSLSRDLLCICDFNGKFKRLNPAWERVLGFSVEELKARPFIEYVHPDDRERTVAEFHRLLQGGETFFFENRYRCKDGSYRWLQWSAATMPQEQIVHAVARDVTEPRRAHDLLARYADALNQRNRTIEEDLVMAREIQQSFLPQRYPTFPPHVSPQQSMLSFCHVYRPAATLGGDFFEIFALSDTQVGVFICDVMGHGIRAALVTAVVRGLLEELRPFAADPGQLLTEINLALIANLKSSTTTIFASAFYLVIDVATGRMLCANAGHPSPFWLRRDVGKSQLLQASANGRGPALGLMSEAEYPSHRYALNPADAVLLFTDGLYEVEGTDGSQFGLARLETEVQNRIRQPCAELVKDLVAEAQKLSPNGDFTDDVCLVGVEAVEAVIGRTWDRPARQPDSSPVEADPGKL